RARFRNFGRGLRAPVLRQLDREYRQGARSDGRVPDQPESGLTMSALWLVSLALLAVLCAQARPASAQDCPTAKTGRTGFIVERDGRSKTEVTHVGDDLVLTVLRQDGKTLLETTQ